MFYEIPEVGSFVVSKMETRTGLDEKTLKKFVSSIKGFKKLSIGDKRDARQMIEETKMTPYEVLMPT